MSKKVELYCEAFGASELFDIDHAERLLGMVNNGGWVLPKNSEFEFSNGVINKRSKKEAAKAE